MTNLNTGARAPWSAYRTVATPPVSVKSYQLAGVGARRSIDTLPEPEDGHDVSWNTASYERYARHDTSTESAFVGRLRSLGLNGLVPSASGGKAAQTAGAALNTSLAVGGIGFVGIVGVGFCVAAVGVLVGLAGMVFGVVATAGAVAIAVGAVTFIPAGLCLGGAKIYTAVGNAFAAKKSVPAEPKAAGEKRPFAFESDSDKTTWS